VGVTKTVECQLREAFYVGDSPRESPADHVGILRLDIGSAEHQVQGHGVRLSPRSPGALAFPLIAQSTDRDGIQVECANALRALGRTE
jgi:hypothetical protein